MKYQKYGHFLQYHAKMKRIYILWYFHIFFKERKRFVRKNKIGEGHFKKFWCVAFNSGTHLFFPAAAAESEWHFRAKKWLKKNMMFYLSEVSWRANLNEFWKQAILFNPVPIGPICSTVFSFFQKGMENGGGGKCLFCAGSYRV
jgi:hypothetical protein